MSGTDVDRFKAEQAGKGVVVVLYKGERVKVAFGSRWEKHTRYRFVASFEDPETGWLESAVFSEGDIVEGRYRDIYFPPRAFAGTYGPMGAVAKGIRSGKAFRGR